jgi:hypothetical protein
MVGSVTNRLPLSCNDLRRSCQRFNDGVDDVGDVDVGIAHDARERSGSSDSFGSFNLF